MSDRNETTLNSEREFCIGAVVAVLWFAWPETAAPAERSETTAPDVGRVRLGLEGGLARWRLPACGGNGCNGSRAEDAPPRYNGDEFREVPGARFVTEYLKPDFRFAGSLTVRDERTIQGDDPSVLDERRPVFNVAVLVVREDVNWAIGGGAVVGTWQPFEGEAQRNLGLAGHFRGGPLWLHGELSASDDGFESAGPGRYRLGLATRWASGAVFLGLAVDEGLFDEVQGATGLAAGLRLGPFAGVSGRVQGIDGGDAKTFDRPSFSVTAGLAYEWAVETETR